MGGPLLKNTRRPKTGCCDRLLNVELWCAGRMIGAFCYYRGGKHGWQR
jgi:hypothetical protein